MNPINAFKEWLLNILMPYIEGTKKKEGQLIRLQFSKNKPARLLINIGFVVGWFFFSGSVIVPHAWHEIYLFFNERGNPYDLLPVFISQLIIFLPMVLGSRYVWTGRIKPRTRMTSSMDD